MSHKKPTKEELKAGLDNLNKELDAPVPTPAPDPEPSIVNPEPDPAPEPTPAPDPAPTPSHPDPEPTPSVPAPSEEDEEKKRLKEQYKGSTREALVHKAGRDALAKAIKEAENVEAPTDAEMEAEYEDWHLLSEGEQKNRIKTVINERRFELINKANKEADDLDQWIKKVEDYSEDPSILASYPELEGKTDEFKAFAITKSRRGVPLADLLKAFLFDVTKESPKKKGGSMIEKPVGGDGSKPKNPTKISMADAEKLRMSNYAEYKRLLRSGQIDMSTIS